MSFETKFVSYLAAFDGTQKDFASMDPLFEELSHPEYTMEENGSTVTREQMKQIQTKAFALGSKATLLHFSQPSPTTIEFKFRLANDQWDMIIHNTATIKDGKIIKEKPVEASKSLLHINFEAYVDAFDGANNDFSEVGKRFETIWHDRFVFQADGISVDKQQLKRYHENLFALGSKAKLELFKEVDPDSVEFKLRMVNDKCNQYINNIAKVKDNKFISAAPVDKAATESVSRVCDVCEAYDEGKVTGDKISIVKAEEDATISSAQ